jgi:thiol-disulfide isomerase/thioredoxin
MGKASRTKQDPDRRARIAAQRAAERRRQQRNRIYIAGGSIFAVIIVAVVVVLFGVNHKAPANNTSTLTGAALTSVVNQVTSVPASTLDAVGTGSGDVNGGSSPIIPLKGSGLTSGGHPEMLYMGAEYCPYCAAERWPMIVALSRFGTFTGLQTIHSAAHDGSGIAEPNPNTPTWTFVHAKFTSNYLTFTPVEMETNIPDPTTGDYTTLETPTKAEDALIDKYDAPPYVSQESEGAIPFVDFGNQYMISGASYDSSTFPSMTWAQIASDLKNPSNSVAKSVDGTANYMTAAICKLTNNQPATACDSTIQGIEKGL